MFVLKETYPIIIIGSFLVEFLNIHPFTDGDGRPSCVLTNLMMLEADYAYMPYVKIINYQGATIEKILEDKSVLEKLILLLTIGFWECLHSVLLINVYLVRLF